MFPENLKKVLNYLNKIGKMKANSGHEDGRVNSISDEDDIIKLLVDKFGENNIELQPPREWYDVRIYGIPCQIKSSDFIKGASDNFSSKLAILYAFTDLDEEELKSGTSTWKGWQNKLLEHRNDNNNRDYYILVFDKSTGNFHLQSLKMLKKLTPNGNNLPFQIKWKDNVDPVLRTGTEAYNFVIDIYAQSVEKKRNSHDGYEKLLLQG